jgi:hypothetical protein
VVTTSACCKVSVPGSILGRVPLKETREVELQFEVAFMSQDLTNLQNKNVLCHFLGCKKVYMLITVKIRELNQNQVSNYFSPNTLSLNFFYMRNA